MTSARGGDFQDNSPVSEKKPLPAEIVDFHVHLFPDRLFEAIRRRFLTDYQAEVIYNLNWRECVGYLRERGVGAIVYSNYAHRAGVARGLNEWNREILAEVDDLYCFAPFHPDDGESPEDLARLFAAPGILGVKLHFLVQRISPADERLFPLYELIIERGKYLLFHVGTGPVGNDFVGARQFERLLRRYPDLPVIVAHMGGLEYREFGDFMKDHPRLYLDTSFSFLSSLGLGFDLGPEFLEEHKERIIYGSDFPNIVFPREEEIANLIDLDLSGEFYRRVFSENGRELIERCRGLKNRESP